MSSHGPQVDAGGPGPQQGGTTAPITRSSSRPRQLDPAMTPDQVVVQLEAGPRRLAAAVQTLYRGNWDDCAEDVRRRAAGRPYLYRLDLPGLRGPEETLSWLRRLGAYESARGERLPAITSA